MKHVAALSGGKDSTAMCLRLMEVEPRDYVFVCTPTGNELPEMEDHWRKIERLLGVDLVRLQDRSLMGLIAEQRALPNHAQRWCTRIIKLEQFYKWLGTLGDVTSYVGLRADEDSRPGMIFPSVNQIIMDFPMRRWGWSIDDVFSYLATREVTVPRRTDCAVCFWQKLGEWYELWRDHPDFYQRGEAAEAFVTAQRGAPYTFRSPQRDTWPASLADLRKEFEAGRVPTLSLKMMDARRNVGSCRACTL